MRRVAWRSDRERGRIERLAPSRHIAAGLFSLAAGVALALPAAAVPLWLDDGSVVMLDQAPRPELKPDLIAWPERPRVQVIRPGGLPDDFDLKAAVGTIIQPVDADGLAEKFDGMGYRLAAVRAGEAQVPRLYVDEMPRDMRKVDSIDGRKRLFIRTMLPLILRANEEVRRERAELQRIADRREAGKPLDSETQDFLDRMKAVYADEDADLDELLRRVDTVPASLALAQAAEESGWGTSRFVREGNAVFGQRTFTGTGGLVPLRRERDETHRVRSFSHVQASVAAYLFNLNTHPAYAGFRAERARLRAAGKDMDSCDLVARLKRYSERGTAYISTIRTIIKVNKLRQFDQAKLTPTATADNNQLHSVRWSL